MWRWGSGVEMESTWNALAVQVDESEESEEEICKEATSKGFILSFLKAQEGLKAREEAT